jgi:hypothetical protein
MRNPFRSMMVVAAVVLAVTVAAPACQCQTVESKEPTKHFITVEPDEKDRDKWKPIPPIEVREGDTIEINGGGNTVWFLIPDNRFSLVEGVSDWVNTESFTAFSVEGEPVIIQLDGCDPDADPTEKIHYSVLARSPKDAPARWDYVHGNNPPPRMTIPPRGQ